MLVSEKGDPENRPVPPGTGWEEVWEPAAHHAEEQLRASIGVSPPAASKYGPCDSHSLRSRQLVRLSFVGLVMECSLGRQLMKMTAILIACLATGLVSADGDDDAKIKEIVKRLGDTRYPNLYPEVYRLLFATAGVNGLARLQAHHDDSIAVQSAWEAVTLTEPVKDGDTVYRPNTQKLNWFLGFLEGRARLSPPDWWREAVLDARANRRSYIYPGEPKSLPYRRSEIGWVSCPKNASVKTTGHAVFYRVGADIIKIPEEILERCDSGELCCNLSGCFTDKHCFIAVHNDFGYPHKIACIERSSRKLVWKSTVCGCWWGMVSGQHRSWVSVVPTDDERVFVFGTATIGFYLHGFRATDGKSLVHFSSNY